MLYANQSCVSCFPPITGEYDDSPPITAHLQRLAPGDPGAGPQPPVLCCAEAGVGAAVHVPVIMRSGVAEVAPVISILLIFNNIPTVTDRRSNCT